MVGSVWKGLLSLLGGVSAKSFVIAVVVGGFVVGKGFAGASLTNSRQERLFSSPNTDQELSSTRFLLSLPTLLRLEIPCSRRLRSEGTHAFPYN